MQNVSLLYYVSSTHNRASIETNGLLSKLHSGGHATISLCDVPPAQTPGMDVWLVDGDGLSLTLDRSATTEHANQYLVIGDVGPERLILERLRIELVPTRRRHQSTPLYRAHHALADDVTAFYTYEELVGIVRLAQKMNLHGGFSARTATTLAAIISWREQERHYAEKSAREGSNPAATHMARLCGDTAKSLELELDDGVSRCVCHMKPFAQRDMLPYWQRALS